MSNTPTMSWIRAGLFALPVFGLLTAWVTIGAQPDASVDPEGWARYVSAPSYLASHLIGASGGTVLAIFGTIALGALLARGRSPRLSLTAMVVAALGQALVLLAGAPSTFALPAMGQAYLEGDQAVATMEFPAAMTATMLLAMVLLLIGNTLLGLAVWRSGIMPAGAGVLWIVGFVVFLVLGAALGMATTGASLPTQPVGALLIAISGAWMAFAARRQPAAEAAPVEPQTSRA